MAYLLFIVLLHSVVGSSAADPPVCVFQGEHRVSSTEDTVSALMLTSSAFVDGKPIPAEFTCEGRNVSPPLAWRGAPARTRSFAMVCDDPDAPRGTWVHWVVYDLPSSITALPEGIPKTETLKNGAHQGRNDFPFTGYGGPCPPRGKPHRYFFKLYALNIMLGLMPGATKEELIEAMTGHVLARAELVGTYKR